MPYSIANTDNIYAKYYLTLSSAKSAIDRGLVSLTKPSRDYLVGDRTVTELKQEGWWVGTDCAPGYMTGGKLPQEQQWSAIRAGAMFPFVPELKVYRCPTGVRG